MKKIIIASVISLLVATTAYADVDLTMWHFKKEIATSDSSNGGFVKVNLDRQTSSNAKQDLSDLRVMANDKDETAYQLVIENETVRNEYRATTLSDLSSKEGETTFIIDLLSNGVLHDHLTVQSDAKNFKHKVSVYAADTHLALSDRRSCRYNHYW